MIAVAMIFCIGVAVMIGMLQLVPSARDILTVMLDITASQAITHTAMIAIATL